MLVELQASHHRECVSITDKETDESWGHIYDPKNQFWAGLDSRASKFGADYEQFLRPLFYVFMGKKNFFLKIL